MNINTEQSNEYRKADYPVDPMFLNRWSSRSYMNEQVPEEMLYTMLEAARWAPSSGNNQPWRFIIARTPEERSIFHEFIRENNMEWAYLVQTYILLASYKFNSKGEPHRSNAFNAGTAWGYLALQASLLGLSTRAIGGFEKEQLKKRLQLSEDYDLHIIIAVGYRGQKELLGESYREKEYPNNRRTVMESILSIPTTTQSSGEERKHVR